MKFFLIVLIVACARCANNISLVFEPVTASDVSVVFTPENFDYRVMVQLSGGKRIIEFKLIQTE